MKPLTLAVLITCALVALMRAESWPQWRGPSLNGVSSETNLPVRWSKTENIAWKLALYGHALVARHTGRWIRTARVASS